MDDHDDLDIKHPHLRLINTPEEIRVKDVSLHYESEMLGRKKGLRNWAKWRGIEKGSLITGLFCLIIIVFATAALFTGAVISFFLS